MNVPIILLLLLFDGGGVGEGVRAQQSLTVEGASRLTIRVPNP